MNINEKGKAFEKLLAGAPEVMSPLQVSKWTPYGRNTVYAMLRSGELPSIQYRGTCLISKAELVEYMTTHADDIPRKRFTIGGIRDVRTSQDRHRRGGSEALTYQQAQVLLDAPERTHPLHRHRQENKTLYHTP